MSSALLRGWRALSLLFFCLCSSSWALPVAANSTATAHEPEGWLASLSLNEITQCLRAHLELHDYSSAIAKARTALKRYPDDPALIAAAIRAYAGGGQLVAALELFDRHAEVLSLDSRAVRSLLHDLAWSVIADGAASESVATRSLATIAAGLTEDFRAVDILCRSMEDPAIETRRAAVLLSSIYRDEKLKKGVLRLFRQDSAYEVRLAAAHALGALEHREAVADLKALLSDESSDLSLRMVATASLVQMLEGLDVAEFVALTESRRSALRLLACEAVGYLGLQEHAAAVLTLTTDASTEVRKAAWRCLGLLKAYQILDIDRTIEQGMADLDPFVAVYASWVYALKSPQQGMEVLGRFLDDSREAVRYEAASAVAAVGLRNNNLLLQMFHKTQDPLVRVNLALALISQRFATKEAAEAVATFLHTCQDRIFWRTGSIRYFPLLSTIDGAADFYRTLASPEEINQKTRLGLLGLLALLNYPDIEKLVKEHLLERNYDLTATAASILLEEGGAYAADSVYSLLDQDDRAIKVRAALLLASWGGEPRAVDLLHKAFHDAPHQMKMVLLEAVAHAGDETSRTFLVQALKDPSQQVRIVASSSLITYLNN
ncbi:hypothetical protein JYU14_03600 [Simkania negevensis]|uniref:HEAT repeat domain-containing protein n=1 Tax=Simkania negevensis TaxID=83561 RepID=A0ABS3AQY9_9BACT|nr:hypothetical protein [Simkania negevensis]